MASVLELLDDAEVSGPAPVREGATTTPAVPAQPAWMQALEAPGDASAEAPERAPAPDIGAMVRRPLAEWGKSRDQVGGFLKLPSIEGLPDVVQSVAQQAPSFTAGFLGVPLDVVDQALELIGSEGVLPNDQTGLSTINAAFQAVGVPAEAVEGMAATMGRDTFVGLTALMALFVAAPTLATAAGLTLPAFLGREIGRVALAHPGLTASMDIGASMLAQPAMDAGGKAGAWLDQMFGSEAQVGETVGETFGAVTGAFAGAGLGKAVHTMAGAPSRALTRFTTPKPTEAPIRDPGVLASEVTSFARRATEVDRMRLDVEIENILNRVPHVDQNTGQISARFRDELNAAHERARAKERGFWEGLLEDEAEVTVSSGLKQMHREVHIAGVGDQGVPSWVADRLEEITTITAKDPKTGKMRKDTKPPQFVQVQRLQSDLLDAAAEARRSFKFKKGDGLMNIVGALREDIAKAATDHGIDPVDIESARAYSRYINDLFRRGPVREVLAHGSDRAAAVPPEQTIKVLFKRFGGVEQAQRIAREQRVSELETEMTRFVERQLQDAILTARLGVPGETGPVATEDAAKAARLFMGRNRELTDKMGKAGGQMAATFEDLGSVQQRLRDLSESAIMRASKTNPETLAHEIYGAPDPKAIVDGLLTRIGDDGLALRGLRNALIDQLWRRSSAGTTVTTTPAGGTATQSTVSPRNVRTQMSHPRVEEALKTALGEPMWLRLKEYVDLGVRLEMGDERLIRRMMRGAGSVAARIVGAQLGRYIAVMTGGGTVQTPGLAAGVAGRVVDRMFSAETAGELLTRAIMDPAWNAVLRSRVPTNTEHMQIMARKLQRAVALTQGTVTTALNERERPRERPPGIAVAP